MTRDTFKQKSAFRKRKSQNNPFNLRQLSHHNLSKNWPDCGNIDGSDERIP